MGEEPRYRRYDPTKQIFLSLIRNALRIHQSYLSSASSSSTSSKQALRFAHPQRPTRLSPHPPPNPPRPHLRPGPARSRASSERLQRQYGVAANQACYLPTCVSHDTLSHTVFFFFVRSKNKQTDNATAPTRLLDVRRWQRQHWRGYGQRVRPAQPCAVVRTSVQQPVARCFFWLVHELASVYPVPLSSNLATGSVPRSAGAYRTCVIFTFVFITTRNLRFI
jgi:hypothetical protein